MKPTLEKIKENASIVNVLSVYIDETHINVTAIAQYELSCRQSMDTHMTSSANTWFNKGVPAPLTSPL